MALINCKDCDKEISETAAACPGCGSPIERKVREGEEQCGFCSTILPDEAMVCTGCGALKGYTYNRGNVYGKWQTIWWGIVLPVILASVAQMFGPTIGAIVVLVVLFVVGMSVKRLITGPVWWKSTNVHHN